MKWLFAVVGFGLVVFMGYWLFTLNQDEEIPAEPTPATAPVQGTEAVTQTESFSSEFTNLSFSYPAEWLVVTGADNDASTQIITLESPQDSNEFYYCLDISDVTADQDPETLSENLEVLQVTELSDGRYGIIYQSQSGVVIWALSDEAATVGDTEINNAITSNGRVLQSFGRFNCREDELPKLQLSEFTGAQLYNESLTIVESLTF